ncbi:hypothetical protein PYCCODRAFT_1228498 [Trametes coccinea BRFM310]|uniref:Uncharacterized protein n=1 Tax=Trametes coccinea (strain BRFM310) TaxID=1353009 RepID=A0A1Y2IW48_TRAC3|nr:hypothetical protein PYCCODRAFT_1228498 [Trametes coccinea BRFM310]
MRSLMHSNAIRAHRCYESERSETMDFKLETREAGRGLQTGSQLWRCKRPQRALAYGFDHHNLRDREQPRLYTHPVRSGSDSNRADGAGGADLTKGWNGGEAGDGHSETGRRVGRAIHIARAEVHEARGLTPRESGRGCHGYSNLSGGESELEEGRELHAKQQIL